MYRAAQPLGILHPKGRIEDMPWGTREFGVLDPDGNLVMFFERCSGATPNLRPHMKRQPTQSALTFFASAAELRLWFEQNAGTAAELIVGFFKVDSGRPSIKWPEAVDEALCVGWVDGVRERIDEVSYKIRFTPRKAGSTWSAVNIEHVEALTLEGRMTAAGRAAFDRRTEEKSRTYSYEQKSAARLAPAEESAFKRHKAA